MHILLHPPPKTKLSRLSIYIFSSFFLPQKRQKTCDAEDSARSVALELPKTRIHSELMLEAVDIVTTD